MIPGKCLLYKFTDSCLFNFTNVDYNLPGRFSRLYCRCVNKKCYLLSATSVNYQNCISLVVKVTNISYSYGIG